MFLGEGRRSTDNLRTPCLVECEIPLPTGDAADFLDKLQPLLVFEQPLGGPLFFGGVPANSDDALGVFGFGANNRRASTAN